MVDWTEEISQSSQMGKRKGRRGSDGAADKLMNVPRGSFQPRWDQPVVSAAVRLPESLRREEEPRDAVPILCTVLYCNLLYCPVGSTAGPQQEGAPILVTPAALYIPITYGTGYIHPVLGTQVG